MEKKSLFSTKTMVATALGAAFFAGLYTGFYKSQEEIKVAKIKAQDIIVEAQKTAENEKNKIINATKEEVRNLKIAADKDIEESRRRAKDDIKREIIDVAFQASEKILQREINEDDNEKVLNNFIDSLNEEEK